MSKKENVTGIIQKDFIRFCGINMILTGLMIGLMDIDKSGVVIYVFIYLVLQAISLGYFAEKYNKLK